MLDIYSDYLIFQNKYATATGLSDLVDGAFAHDKVTRFLRLKDYDSKSLWGYVKKPVRTQETSYGVLILALSQKYFLSTEGFILNEFMLLVRRTVQKWIVFPIEYAVFF